MMAFLCCLAVQAARPGSQAAALTQTRGRTCRDFKDTLSDKRLKEVGVKRPQGKCVCGLGFASRECGDIEEVKKVKGTPVVFRAFDLRAAGPGCRCLGGRDKAKERSEVVAAAAVRFCAAVLEETSQATYAMVESVKQDYIRDDLKVSPQLCQEILTGTLDDFGTPQSKTVFGEANGLSTHKGTKGWGHLDPLVLDPLPSSADYHQKLLRHICHDECVEIVNETLKNIKKMDDDVDWRGTPSERTCADNVVRKVEAEILGCCGRSCGWDSRSCRSWPFFDKTEKVDWLQQCCSEYNVLQNSTRERMCDSVLSPKQIRLVSQFDTKAKKGDVGAAYVGQDPQLLWAEPGLDEFHKQLKLKQPPKENEPVGSDFFEKNPDVRKQGLEKGWFREDPEQPTSLAQLGGTTCDESLQKMKNKEHCTDETWRKVLNTCVQAEEWQISAKPDPNDDDLDGPPECQLKMIDPNVNKPQKVATPEECRKMDFGPGRRFFIYDKSEPPEGELILDKPILCFHEKKPCPDVERRNLNQVDRNRFKNFAEYIYWTEGA